MLYWACDSCYKHIVCCTEITCFCSKQIVYVCVCICVLVCMYVCLCVCVCWGGGACCSHQESHLMCSPLRPCPMPCSVVVIYQSSCRYLGCLAARHVSHLAIYTDIILLHLSVNRYEVMVCVYWVCCSCQTSHLARDTHWSGLPSSGVGVGCIAVVRLVI